MALLTAETVYGTVRGVPSEKNPQHSVFRGIPFAAPPTGERRFAPPQEPAAWEGERLCAGFAPACMQANGPGGKTIPVSEDCLYLNIYTPAETAGEQLPVLFWIYGGGFAGGWSGDPEFDGEAINREGAILVTCGYRCGIFGFISLPELMQRNGPAGNLGLLDQIAALTWVQKNIAAFGGDPERVTVFGQSAGGISTRMLLCAPPARGLFSRAIMESGGGLNEADPVRSREEYTQLCQNAMAHAGLTFPDLMQKDAAEILERMNQGVREAADTPEVGWFQPFIDGATLPDVPGLLISRGQYMDIPLISMTVAGDAWMFCRKVENNLGDNMQYFRGFSFSAPLAWAQYQVEQGRTPLYTLYMDRTQPADCRAPAGRFGAQTPHCSEIAYVFGTLAERSSGYTEPDETISRTMTAYWVQFAAAGDPNAEGLPDWPAYTAQTPLTMHVGDDGIQAEQIVRSPEEQRVLDFTKAHPGLLCSVDGLF